jgi:hypothetical protein
VGAGTHRIPGDELVIIGMAGLSVFFNRERLAVVPMDVENTCAISI